MNAMLIWETVSHMKSRMRERATASRRSARGQATFQITRTTGSQANLRQFNRLREPSTARR